MSSLLTKETLFMSPELKKGAGGKVPWMEKQAGSQATTSEKSNPPVSKLLSRADWMTVAQCSEDPCAFGKLLLFIKGCLCPSGSWANGRMNGRVTCSVSDELLESCFTLFPAHCAFLLLPPSPGSVEAGDEHRDWCGSPLSWGAVRSFQCLSTELAFLLETIVRQCICVWSWLFRHQWNGCSPSRRGIQQKLYGHRAWSLFWSIVMVDFTEYVFPQMLLLQYWERKREGVICLMISAFTELCLALSLTFYVMWLYKDVGWWWCEAPGQLPCGITHLFKQITPAQAFVWD